MILKLFKKKNKEVDAEKENVKKVCANCKFLVKAPNDKFACAKLLTVLLEKKTHCKYFELRTSSDNEINIKFKP